MPYNPKQRRARVVKRTYKKRKQVRGVRRAVARPNPMVMINRSVGPVARRFFTHFTCDRQFDIVHSKAAGGAPTGYFDIAINNGLPLPFEFTNLAQGVQIDNTTYNLGDSGTVTEATYSNIPFTQANFAGLSQLFDNGLGDPSLYNSLKVHGAMCTMQVTYAGRRQVESTLSPSSNLALGIIPYLTFRDLGVSANANGPIYIDRLRQSPYGRSVTVSGVSGKTGFLKAYTKISSLLGCSKQAIKNDLSNATTSTIQAGAFTDPLRGSANWRVVWAASGGALAGDESVEFTLKIRLKIYVELGTAGSNLQLQQS